MSDGIARSRIALGAAVLFAFLVVPVAFAGGGDPDATTSASVKKQVKKLKGQVKDLQAQVAALQGEQGGGRPPTGTAGGDLTGQYPNPQVAANAINSDKIAPNAVTSEEVLDETLVAADLNTDSVGDSEIAANAVDQDEIEDSGVDAAELGDSVVGAEGNFLTIAGGTAHNGIYNLGSTTATCPAGAEILAGHGQWTDDNNPTDNEELFISEVTINDAAESVTVQFGNDSGTTRHAQAVAVCLLA